MKKAQKENATLKRSWERKRTIRGGGHEREISNAGR
jgi:hypothetical protein